MNFLANLISQNLLSLDFSHPWAYIDLALALFLAVGFLVYLHRFPVFRVVLGIIFLIACAAFFFLIGFILTALVFAVAANLTLISLPLIFAPEIRHYLEKLGRFSFLRVPTVTEKQRIKDIVHGLTYACYELADKRIGATVVIQRRTGLGETIDTGTLMDAKFSPKLLENIFFPKSPLHDGAVVLRGDRIAAAGCLLPILPQAKLSPPFGTRHKSGLSITLDTDAVVVIVSEQRGEVSLAENGRLHTSLDRVQLISRLQNLLLSQGF